MKFTATVIDRPSIGLQVSIHVRGPHPEVAEEELVTKAGIRLRVALPKDSNLRKRVLHELNWEARLHWEDPILIEAANP
jgi:hypothetical protein